jgi:hypothetical protein
VELKLSRVARPVALVALALVLAGYSWWAMALSAGGYRTWLPSLVW